MRERTEPHTGVDTAPDLAEPAWARRLDGETTATDHAPLSPQQLQAPRRGRPRIYVFVALLALVVAAWFYVDGDRLSGLGGPDPVRIEIEARAARLEARLSEIEAALASRDAELAAAREAARKAAADHEALAAALSAREREKKQLELELAAKEGELENIRAEALRRALDAAKVRK